MMTIEQAIRKILAAWGITDSYRIEAIQLVMDGTPPDRVVRAIEDMAGSLGAFEALKGN